MITRRFKKWACGLALLGIALLFAFPAFSQNVVKRYKGTVVADRFNGAILAIAGTDITSTAAELNYADVTTAGAAQASKAVVLDASKAVTGIGHIAPAAGTAFTAADPNPSRATLRANAYFLVDTTANAVDLDFSNDADLEAADLGKRWTFIVSAGGTNALTVTDGASGVLVKLQATAGATCEDVGDRYECMAYALEGVTCASFCAD